MTCPICRAQGREVEVELVSAREDPRASETVLFYRCPVCGWRSEAYRV